MGEGYGRPRSAGIAHPTQPPIEPAKPSGSLAAMSTPELASVNGKIGPTAEAMVPLRDDGLYRGDGAFEVIKLYAGRPFALPEHVERLSRSAASIELEFDLVGLAREIDALLAEFGDADGQLRLIVTRGGMRLAMTEPAPEHAATATVATITYSPTVVLNGVKSLSYAANMQTTRLAKAQGADEAIFVKPDGTILEAPTSTLFWVSDDRLRTTAVDAGVLDSITRRRLLAELEVEEGTWKADDLMGASEAFLASSAREIQAVSAVNGEPLPAAPGPWTERATEAFAAVLKRELES